MEILLHKALGGFHIPYEFEETTGIDPYGWDGDYCLIDHDNNDSYHKMRTHKDLIALFKANRGCFNRNMVLVNIPDNCFYAIENYDGYETLRYSKTEIKEL